MVEVFGSSPPTSCVFQHPWYQPTFLSTLSIFSCGVGVGEACDPFLSVAFSPVHLLPGSLKINTYGTTGWFAYHSDETL